jgi:hypothetical protein
MYVFASAKINSIPTYYYQNKNNISSYIIYITSGCVYWGMLNVYVDPTHRIYVNVNDSMV